MSATNSKTIPEDQDIVYVVDDDDSVRDAIRCMLEAAHFQVHCYDSARAFLEAYTGGTTRNQCLLLDVRMPGMDGLELQKQLVERQCYLPIIILTAHGDVPTAVRALRAGAVDFMEKPFDEEQLIRRIRETIASNLQLQWEPGEREAILARMEKLSDRERQVLQMLAEGKWVKRIASELGTSPNTVKNQRTRILEKMQAETVPELVRMVMISQMKPPSV